MTVTGNADYCFGGVDCDPVPAEMPVPPGAHLEGSQDLTCDAGHTRTATCSSPTPPSDGCTRSIRARRPARV